jgi:hypothetical protein
MRRPSGFPSPPVWAWLSRPAFATEALARNPGARPGIFIFLILGLAFIESLALFTFVIIFLKVK